MKVRSAQGGLAALFLTCLSIQTAMFFGLVARHALKWEEAWPLLKGLLVVYSVPLAVILGGVFANTHTPQSRPRASTVWLALAVSALWNALLVVPALIYFVSSDSSPSSIELALKNSASANFLVAGALAYFFGEHK